MPITNKPDYGSEVVENGRLKPPFQQFIDSLVDQVNANEVALAKLREDFDLFVLIADTLYAVAAYGGISNTGSEAIPDISTGFQTLPYNTVSVADPRLVIQDLANNGLIVEREGIWLMSIAFALEFLDINSGRHFDVRLFDATEGVVVATSNIFVGRNQAGSNYAVSLLVTISEEAAGHLITVQIGNADTDFTSVVLDANVLNVVHVSERNVGE